MRVVVQRVSRAEVRVDGAVVGRIGRGLLALVGVAHGDTDEDADVVASKLANLRVMADDAGVMNRSVIDTGGAVLVVSQFTLHGDVRRGRRPSWGNAAPGDIAEPIVARVVDDPAVVRSRGGHGCLRCDDGGRVGERRPGHDRLRSAVGHDRLTPSRPVEPAPSFSRRRRDGGLLRSGARSRSAGNGHPGSWRTRPGRYHRMRRERSGLRSDPSPSRRTPGSPPPSRSPPGRRRGTRN